MGSQKLLLALWLCVACALGEDLVTKSSNRFAINLFKKINEEHRKPNLVFSPLSAYIALSMAAYGASGQTYEQMRWALGLPKISEARKGFQSLIKELNVHEDVALSVANKLFLANDFTINSTFSTVNRDIFSSSSSTIDPKNLKESAEKINRWASDSTNGKIKDFVKEGDLENARMLLLNAVYFKADWEEKFNKAFTKPRSFETSRSKKLVQTMFVNKEFYWGYMENLKTRFIQLPYKNKEFKMTIFVPHDISLNELINNFDVSTLAAMSDSGMTTKVQLSMPKFKIDTTSTLNEPLKKLGMINMFESGKANFTKISSLEKLYVKDVKQKAVIEVNEEGSEAAAVTGLQVALLMADTVFKVDRPSLIMISKNDTILFMARLDDPLY